MSVILVVALPLALLGVVALLGFVGCSYQPGAVPADFYDYQTPVTENPAFVALWPLNDTSGTTATELSVNQLNGTYTPAPPASYDATNLSAAASGAINIGQPGIVAGDTRNSDPNQRATCPFFDGGFVSIPWSDKINIQPPFTLEAWVKPTWTDQDVVNEPALRGVVMAVNPTNNTGFGIFVTPDNFWAAVFGTTSGLVSVAPPTGSNQKVMLNTVSYLVLTFDGTTAKLYVNPADGTPYAQAPVSGYVPLPSPTPMYIGAARPDLPPPPNPGFPFKGFIQDVAFYNAVLDDMTIQTHNLNGNGMKMT